MSRAKNQLPDPEDMFADSRMTFGEHIDDLRTHLLRAIYGFVILFVASFFIARPVLRFIAAPVERVLGDYYNELFEEKARQIVAENREKDRMLRQRMKIDIEELKGKLGLPRREDAILQNLLPSIEHMLRQIGFEDLEPTPDGDRLVEMTLFVPDPLQHALALERLRTTIRPPTLSTLSVQEAFVVYIKVAILTGLVLSSPWVFWQIWSFVAAGLYPHEKRLVHVFLPISLLLFLGGVIVCQLYVIPKAVEALLWFNKYLGLQPDLRLSEWLGFAIMMPLVFGVSFQTPLVMLFLERIGIVEVQTYRDKRKMAIFLLAVFSAIITPSVDIFSMMLLFLPLCLLYELGIWLCALSPREKLFESEWEDSDELIEV